MAATTSSVPPESRDALYDRMRAERAALTARERVELEDEYRVWVDASEHDVIRHERELDARR